MADGNEVVYEVNLEVDQDVVEEYGAWLTHHLKEIVDLPGFLDATWQEVEILGAEAEGSVAPKRWSIRYRVQSRDALQKYFDEFAPKMRGDGVKRFKSSFKASRRVLSALSRVPRMALDVGLAYFACQGRALPISYMLGYAGVPYSYQEEKLEDWKEMKKSTMAGPLQMLPVLTWNGTQVTQTTAIAAFLSRKLFLEGHNDAHFATTHAVVSSAYNDLLSPLMALMWCTVRTPSSSAEETLASILPRIQSILGLWDAQLKANDNRHVGFIPGDGFSAGDLFAAAAVSVVCDLFGEDKVLAGKNALAALVRAVWAHEGVKKARGRARQNLTCSPKEADIRLLLVDKW